MIDITFAAPIVPRGQPAIRARAFIDPKTKKPVASTYQPKDAAQWKSDLRVYAEQHQPDRPIDEPVRLDILAVMPRPQNRNRRKDPIGLIACTSKPDGDNIRKAVQDALNKIWWRDDALICCGQTLKAYAEKDGHPRLVLRVRTMPDVARIASELQLAVPSSGAPATQGELGDLTLLRAAIDNDDVRETHQPELIVAPEEPDAGDDDTNDETMSNDELDELFGGSAA